MRISALIFSSQILSILPVRLKNFDVNVDFYFTKTVGHFFNMYVKHNYRINVFADNTTAFVVNEFLKTYPTVNLVFNCDAKYRQIFGSRYHDKQLNIIGFEKVKCFKYFLTKNRVTAHDVILFMTGHTTMTYLVEDLKGYLIRLSQAGRILIMDFNEVLTLYSMCFFCGAKTERFIKQQEVHPDGFFKQNKEIFVNEYNDFNGHLLNIGYINYFPYIYCLETAPGPPHVTCITAIGEEFDLLTTISRTLNFKFRLIPARNSTYEALVEDLRSGHFDFAIGGLSMTEERRREFHFSVVQKFEPVVLVYFYEKSWNFALLTYKGSLRDRTKVIAMTGLMTLFVYMVYRCFEMSRRSFFGLFENIVYIAVDRPTSLRRLIPQRYKYSIHVVLTFWFFYAIISNTRFRSQLTASTIAKQAVRIDLSQLLAENYQLVTDHDLNYVYASLYQGQESWFTEENIVQKTDLCETFHYISHHKALTIGELSRTFFHMMMTCKNRISAGDLKEATIEDYARVPLAWPFRTGAPFIYAINKHIQKIRSAGFTNVWYQRSLAQQQMYVIYNILKGYNDGYVHFHVFLAQTFFYSLCLVLCLVVFFIELIVFKLKKVCHGS